MCQGVQSKRCVLLTVDYKLFLVLESVLVWSDGSEQF